MFRKPGLDAVIFSPEVRTVQFLPFAVVVVCTHKSTQVQIFRLGLAHHEPIFITPVHPVRLGQISFRQCVLAVTHPCDRCTDILTQHIHRVEFRLPDAAAALRITADAVTNHPPFSS